MIRFCGKSVALPLTLIFEAVIDGGIFSDCWKKSNVVPCHKKHSKNLIKNYRLISFPQIFSKVFERSTYNSLHNYFIENKLFSEYQFGFMPGDPWVSQLLSITHKIYKSFDYNPSIDIRGVFLDISKAFDKVWHDGLIFKLQKHDIDGEFLKLFKSYLKDRQQGVLLNGQTSSWKNILVSVLQGSVFGPLLFLIYIKYLPDGLTSLCKIFADDTSPFLKAVNRKKPEIEPNKDLKLISQLAYQWKKLFNRNPTKQATEVCFSRPIEMKTNSRGLPIMKYCRPPWLADEENFSFQIV